MKIPDKFRILLVTLPLLFILFVALGWLLYQQFGHNAAELIYNSRKPLIDIPSAAALKVKMDAISSKFIPAFSWFTSWFIIMLAWLSKQIKLSISQFLESRKKYTYISFLFITLAGAFILMWPAILNGYPLLFKDSAYYILARRPAIRPIGYTFFILATSLNWSLWITIFAQSFLTSFLVMRNTDAAICENKFKRLIPFAILILMCAMTSLPKYTSWLMTDLFAGLLFLSSTLFLLSDLKIDKIAASLSIMLSLFSHPSHVLIAILYFSILFFSGLIYRHIIPPAIWDNIKKLSSLTILILVSIGFLNFGYGGGFRLSYQNSANFTLYKFIYSGIASKTLEAYCPVKKWKLCQYQKEIKEAIGKKESLFLWSPSSPIHKTGGFENQREQNEIVFYSVKTFFPDILKLCIRATFRQLLMINELGKVETDPSIKLGVYQTIRYKYPNDFSSFINSRRMRGFPSRSTLAPSNTLKFQLAILILVCFSACIFIYKRKISYLLLLFSSLLFVFINALVFGFVTTPSHRYQERVMWIISYCLFVSVAGFLKKLFSRI
ncbi:MAG: hypothetical protein Q8N91_04815 [Candidatus Omnitrophota bacterium]|nr:hypothetical protein [Candidatus Omnitrophota bacterium]